MKRYLRFSFGLLFLSILIACSPRPAPVVIGTGSSQHILSPLDLPQQSHQPTGWFIKGMTWDHAFSSGLIVPTRFDNHKALRFQAPPNSADSPIILGRMTKARLSVAPYLTWRWVVPSLETKGLYPHHLLIGFYREDPQNPTLSAEKYRWTKEAPLPPAHRLLAIGFHDSALKRGSFMTLNQIPFYIQRGGWENTNQWHDEAVDLLHLYRQNWPQDPWQDVIITFVAVASHPYSAAAQLVLGPITLSR